MVRYPHTILLKREKSISFDAEQNLVSIPETISVRGRVEMDNSGATLNDRGVVYLPKNEVDAIETLLQRSTVEFEGTQYRIVTGVNYQSHIELYIE